MYTNVIWTVHCIYIHTHIPTHMYSTYMYVDKHSLNIYWTYYYDIISIMWTSTGNTAVAKINTHKYGNGNAFNYNQFSKLPMEYLVWKQHSSWVGLLFNLIAEYYASFWLDEKWIVDLDQCLPTFFANVSVQWAKNLSFRNLFCEPS